MKVVDALWAVDCRRQTQYREVVYLPIKAANRLIVGYQNSITLRLSKIQALK
jgi:hypothetical protein